MSKVGTYNAFDGKLDLNIYIVINPDDTIDFYSDEEQIRDRFLKNFGLDPAVLVHRLRLAVMNYSFYKVSITSIFNDALQPIWRG